MGGDQHDTFNPRFAKDRERVRTYAFLYALAVVTFSYVSFFVESEELIASFDDMAVIGIAAIGLFLIAVVWLRRPSPNRAARLNDVLFILGLWMLVFSVFALEVEAGFSDDLVDEVPKLAASVLLIVNRFL